MTPEGNTYRKYQTPSLVYQFAENLPKIRLARGEPGTVEEKRTDEGERRIAVASEEQRGGNTRRA